ncbi:hypothetical protein [Erythrobacter colymbi]|uniref:hypothetical protein n=1 Tax=Erythrobacter colymbi TaxID=1161202 RepID=UPI000A362FBA|nr:hypothetical protein [Erythrobacter colymbi]
MARIIATWLAALVLVAPAAAQRAPEALPEAEPAPVIYALLQISLKPGKVASGEFRSRMEAIRSCPEAVKVAAELGAEVVRNARVSPEQLPPKLRPVLENLPVGHATPVFTGSGNTLRVLVLCQRS